MGLGSQCYLPPDRGDIPALTSAKLRDPGGMQGRANLVGCLHTEMVHPHEDGHPFSTNQARHRGNYYYYYSCLTASFPGRPG